MVVALLLGATFLPSTADAKSTDVHLSAAQIARCLAHNATSKAASDVVPALLDGSSTLHGPGLSPGDQVIGGGAIWVTSEAIHRTAGFDIDSHEWRIAKFPWFRTRPGRLRVGAEREDGAGTFSLDIPPESSYPTPGFVPSDLVFSSGGCWKVTASFRRTTISFFVAFSSTGALICKQLRAQVDDVEQLRAALRPGDTWPAANDAYEAKLKRELEARDC